MTLKRLRDGAQLSQEKLADMSGVSLRTVQRAESGHRVGYASMRALALALKMDVDALERELYAVKRSAEFIEIPRWVRWLNGRFAGFQSSSRRQALRAEKICVATGVLFIAASLFAAAEFPATAFRIAGLFNLVVAYGIAVTIRVTDDYQAWPGGETSLLTAPTGRTWRATVLQVGFLLLVCLAFLAVLLAVTPSGG